MPEKECIGKRAVVFNTYALTVCALLTALSVILARLLTIIPSEISRFSLEAVPILLAGLLFGPVPGAAVGFAADFIGCLFSPSAITPSSACRLSFTVCGPGCCAAMRGQSPPSGGWRWRYSRRRCAALVLWQSAALALVYGGEAKLAFFLTRLASRSIAVTGVIDTAAVWLRPQERPLPCAAPLENKGA